MVHEETLHDLKDEGSATRSQSLDSTEDAAVDCRRSINLPLDSYHSPVLKAIKMQREAAEERDHKRKVANSC